MLLSFALRRAAPRFAFLKPSISSSLLMPSKRKRVPKDVDLVAKGHAEYNTSTVVAPSITTGSKVSIEAAPSRRISARIKKAVSYTEQPATIEDGDESPLTGLDEAEEEELPKPPVKKRRQRKNLEPVVYDIPPVETKTTAYHGRLGYACLNTILRASKPDSIFCSRTCRKDTINKNGLDFAKELGRQNVRDLSKLIRWNEENHIKFLRVSSEMFPFASHAELGYNLEYAREELKAAGDLANRLGHRLTTHPGQFTQLASPKDSVVEASIRDLEYHCQMMRYMGVGKDGVIILHMGGVYGDKETTLARFKENYQTKLTDEMKARLVLENDEICYNVDDLLPICNELDIPLVLDYHHDWINPSTRPVSELIPLINEIWHRKGIKPKQHLSSPRPGAESVMEKRAHADRCYELPVELSDDMDLMIEAKDKEQAVFHLHRIYNLHPVIHENLRPEKPPKPFVRNGNGQEDGDEGDGEAIVENGESVKASRLKRRTRKGKAKEKPKVEDDTLVGVAPAIPGDIAGITSAKKSKKSRNRKKKTGTDEQATAVKMMNQEEYVKPIDGGDVEKVEEEEHAEVMKAAEEQKRGKEKNGKNTKGEKGKKEPSQNIQVKRVNGESYVDMAG